MKITIYALGDPRTNKVRYVGRTSQNPIVRFGQHLGDVYRNTGHNKDRCEWIRGLAEQGMMPILSILATVDAQEGAKEENRWIAHFKNKGDLLNKLTFESRCEQGPTQIELAYEYLDNHEERGTWMSVEDIPTAREIANALGIAPSSAHKARANWIRRNSQ